MIFFKNRNVTVLTFIGLLMGISGVGIVFYEKDYLYSSAKDYSDEKGLVKISLL